MPETLLDSSTSNFNHSILKDFKLYEAPINPNPGDRKIDSLSPFDNSKIIARPKELQVSTIVFNSADHQKHFEKVSELERQWNLILGIDNKGRSRFLAHDPILDRAEYDLQIENGATDEQLRSLKNNLDIKLQATLCERFHATRSVVRYFLDQEGNAYSENDFAHEPVDVIFQRGALFRIAQGSTESERELSAVEGGIRAKKELAEEKVGCHSKRIVVSPAGTAVGTVYKDNFVDIYEKDIDPETGRTVITMTRFASSLNNEEYRERLNILQPDFFDGETGSFDSWCLKNPIPSDQQESHIIFNENFKGQKDATGENEMKKILQGCSSLIQYYNEVICSEVFNPREIALTFNALLHKADGIKESLANKVKNIFNSVSNFGKEIVQVFKNVRDEIAWRGIQTIKTVMGGCGSLGAFSIGGSLGSLIRSIGSLISGSLSGFRGIMGSLSGKSEWFCKNCPVCGSEINCEVKPGESCPNPNCGAIRQCG